MGWQQTLRGPADALGNLEPFRIEPHRRGGGDRPLPRTRALGRDPLAGWAADGGYLPVGDLLLEVLEFVPSQTLQRDPSVEMLFVSTSCNGLAVPPLTTDAAPKRLGAATSFVQPDP